MLIEPTFAAHANCRGTLFDALTVFARWDVNDDCYRLARVTLTFRLKTFSLQDDLRYKPKTFGIDFRTFASRVRDALSYFDQFVELKASLPQNTKAITKQLDQHLIMTAEGVYLAGWGWAPIYDWRTQTPKLATLAILELLELEATLPTYRL